MSNVRVWIVAVWCTESGNGHWEYLMSEIDGEFVLSKHVGNTPVYFKRREAVGVKKRFVTWSKTFSHAERVVSGEPQILEIGGLLKGVK